MRLRSEKNPSSFHVPCILVLKKLLPLDSICRCMRIEVSRDNTVAPSVPGSTVASAWWTSPVAGSRHMQLVLHSSFMLFFPPHVQHASHLSSMTCLCASIRRNVFNFCPPVLDSENSEGRLSIPGFAVRSPPRRAPNLTMRGCVPLLAVLQAALSSLAPGSAGFVPAIDVKQPPGPAPSASKRSCAQP